VQSGNKVLYVGNVHPDVTEMELRSHFAGFGEIELIRVR
jgi:RNA recognition motif-containing protein